MSFIIPDSLFTIDSVLSCVSVVVESNVFRSISIFFPSSSVRPPSRPKSHDILFCKAVLHFTPKSQVSISNHVSLSNLFSSSIFVFFIADQEVHLPSPEGKIGIVLAVCLISSVIQVDSFLRIGSHSSDVLINSQNKYIVSPKIIKPENQFFSHSKTKSSVPVFI